jgi:membrane protease YdiL (CAAX protease family)
MTHIPGPLDYALVSVMIAFMVIEVFSFAALGRAEARGTVRDMRMRVYAFFMTYQWALVACIVILWSETKRPWSALLLGSPNRWGFAVSVAFAASFAVLTVLQRRAIANRPKLLERLRGRIAEIKSIVPHTAEERRIWTLAAITAGTCEEVLFRGYLLTFIASIEGIIAAVLVCAVLFGLYHAYYGPKGILKTGAFGLLMTLIALWSGSLIPVIIIHATVDLSSGDIGYLVLSNTLEPTPA